MKRGLHALTVAAALGCTPSALAGPDCSSFATDVALPQALAETSGVAVGRLDPRVLWTHNDDGSDLFAVDSTGAVRAEWRVRPRLRDWEDIESAPCGAHGSCLYFADTGDNDERRRPGDIRIARVAEPSMAPSGGGELTAEIFPIRLPDGPRDIEALYLLPGERLFLVTKGRSHPITVYAYPPPLRSDTVTVDEVQRLGHGPVGLPDQVTGASASREGDVVAVRSYQALELFRIAGDTLARSEDGSIDLRPLRESQGEAVGLGADGLVVLTSEAGFFSRAPGMNLLRCTI
jgi:hypothetical protein